MAVAKVDCQAAKFNSPSNFLAIRYYLLSRDYISSCFYAIITCNTGEKMLWDKNFTHGGQVVKLAKIFS